MISALNSLVLLTFYMLLLSQIIFKVLLVWDFSSHLRIFHSYADVTITIERLQILTYILHSWPLSSEGFKTCHAYCDNNHLLQGPRTLTPVVKHLAVELSQSCFNDLDLPRPRIKPQSPSCKANALPLRHRCVF